MRSGGAVIEKMRSGGTSTSGGQPSGRRAPSLAAQFDEFIKRGTPRQSSALGSSSRGFSLRRLEQQVAAWIQARGLPPLTARPLTVLAVEDGTSFGLTARGERSLEGAEFWARGVVLYEASILLSGVELVVTIYVPNISGPCSARVFEPKLMAAQSCCAWPAAQQRLAVAVEVASGQPLEDFFDVLWNDGMPWGNHPSSNEGPAADCSSPAADCSSSPLAERIAPFGRPSMVKEKAGESSDEGSSSTSSCSSSSVKGTAVGKPADKPTKLRDAQVEIQRLQQQLAVAKEGEQTNRRHSASGMCMAESSDRAAEQEESQCEMLPDIDEAELAPLPPDSKCWDWPLSRNEKKVRISLLERQMHAMDRKLWLQDLRRDSSCCDSDSEGCVV